MAYYGFEEWDGKDLDDDEFSPEDLAKIKRGIQEANMGLTYSMVREEGSFVFKCNKCGRKAEIGDEPFPHKFDCPMKRL